MCPDRPSHPTPEQRVVRVFLSSTFRDMHRERDELIKRVFPELRKVCEARGVTWNEVDLRWGVTEEEKAEGKVLPICLAEIHRSRPYFIGLLGERYGWIPQEIPAELIQSEPWLADHLNQSVTELEILHGVLNNPAMAGHALFYFRDPAFIDTLPPAERPDFLELATAQEITTFGREEAERRAEERRQKLAALKRGIRNSGLPVWENYPTPQVLGELVLHDLTRVIDRLYPKGSEPDPLAREALEHEAFAQSRARVYVGRRADYARLDEHVRGNGPPLVVLGESGSGKSALLANWALHRRNSSADELLLMHFIGATPYSADWAAMLRRLMGEFKRHFGLEGEIPDRPDALRAAFANSLQIVASKGRVVVLVLDALNQLEDRDGALDLVWLPPVIPSNVRLILSTLPGRPFADLRKRGWPTVKVAPLDVDERKQLTVNYLAQYAKALSPARAERITRANQTAYPLYLRALLDELRVFGVHELLDDRIGHYLSAKTIPELYEKILTRYEQDYERDRPGLVGDAMSLIWAARRGLAEVELMDLLGADQEPLPRAHWSPLYLAAESSLVSRSGLIAFAHEYFRQAVGHRYLAAERTPRAAHLRLAHYFERQGLRRRTVEELPWQFAAAKVWPRLAEVLVGRSFFAAAWHVNEFDVKSYWAQIERHSPLRAADVYRSVIEAPAEDSDYGWRIGLLLNDLGHTQEALALRRRLVDHFRQTGNLAELHGSLVNQAVTLKNLGQLDEALQLFKEAERICRESGNQDGLQRTLGGQALILKNRGELREALRLLEEDEAICRAIGNRNALTASLCNQANVLYNWGRLDEALRLYKEQERICREVGDMDALQVGLGNQANILDTRGQPEEAMRLLKEKERVCRELGIKRGLAASLGSQANLLFARGDLDGAMRLYKEEERISRETGDKHDLQECLGGQANILCTQKKLDEASRLYKEQERMCRELGNKDGLQISLGNQATIFHLRGNLEEATRLHKEEERICRELGNKDGIQTSLGNQALILQKCGRLEDALKLLQERERICRELGNNAGLTRSLLGQASLLTNNLRRPREALSLAEEAYKLATTHRLTALVPQIQSTLETARSMLPR